jgi:hypothetical protein
MWRGRSDPGGGVLPFDSRGVDRDKSRGRPVGPGEETSEEGCLKTLGGCPGPGLPGAGPDGQTGLEGHDEVGVLVDNPTSVENLRRLGRQRRLRLLSG